MVLNSLPSEHSRDGLWHRGAGHPQFGKAVVQRYAAELREAGIAPSSVNQRLSAVRKLAAEAADNGARLTSTCRPLLWQFLPRIATMTAREVFRDGDHEHILAR